MTTFELDVKGQLVTVNARRLILCNPELIRRHVRRPTRNQSDVVASRPAVAEARSSESADEKRAQPPAWEAGSPGKAGERRAPLPLERNTRPSGKAEGKSARSNVLPIDDARRRVEAAGKRAESASGGPHSGSTELSESDPPSEKAEGKRISPDKGSVGVAPLLEDRRPESNPRTAFRGGEESAPTQGKPGIYFFCGVITNFNNFNNFNFNIHIFHIFHIFNLNTLDICNINIFKTLNNFSIFDICNIFSIIAGISFQGAEAQEAPGFGLASR
jgi:hypothetical protein